MNILITGGAGFIGSHLTDRLLKEGHTIICFDNFDYFYSPELKWMNVQHNINNPAYKLVSGTITDVRAFEKAFAREPIDAIVHLAAQAGVRPSMQNPNLHFEVNVLGTVNALELCRKYNVKKFVIASSSSVYGNHPETPFKETHTVTEPLCPYAASKKAAELIAYTYHYLYDMDVACIRPFTVYGSRQRLEMAIPLFTRLIYNHQQLTVHGQGAMYRDYTHVSDVVDGIVRILQREHGYQIYNLGSSAPIPLNALIQEIWRNLHSTALKFVELPNITYGPEGIGEAKITFADITKAKEMLGYAPKMNITLGIAEYVAWYLQEVVKEKGE